MLLGILWFSTENSILFTSVNLVLSVLLIVQAMASDNNILKYKKNFVIISSVSLILVVLLIVIDIYGQEKFEWSGVAGWLLLMACLFMYRHLNALKGL